MEEGEGVGNFVRDLIMPTSVPVLQTLSWRDLHDCGDTLFEQYI